MANIIDAKEQAVEMTREQMINQAVRRSARDYYRRHWDYTAEQPRLGVVLHKIVRDGQIALNRRSEFIARIYVEFRRIARARSA